MCIKKSNFLSRKLQTSSFNLSYELITLNANERKYWPAFRDIVKVSKEVG